MLTAAPAPDGAVYVKVIGLGAAPATVRAIWFNVSVKTPLLVTVIWLPFASVAVPAPEAAPIGGRICCPDLDVIAA